MNSSGVITKWVGAIAPRYLGGVVDHRDGVQHRKSNENASRTAAMILGRPVRSSGMRTVHL